MQVRGTLPELADEAKVGHTYRMPTEFTVLETYVHRHFRGRSRQDDQSTSGIIPERWT